ncbi:MAG: D-alanyl-D-alanine carboxypeptidase family protein [bacterium]|nr:D-alanyl-D-alanine carboxypeptidase family protein [bacterium]
MTKRNLETYTPLIAFAILLGGGIYAYIRIYALNSKIEALSANITSIQQQNASTTADLRANIKENHETLAAALNQQTLNVGVVEQRLKEQVGNVAGTLTTLQKLSRTDKELLAKYSKVFFLSENYAPARLTDVPASYKYSDKKAVSVHADVWPSLQNMIDDAKKAEIELYISSGFRSFDEQKALKGDYKVTYGAGTANQFSADQGYSEHQLGTAVDFLTTGINGDLDRFDGTPAYNWLLANAYRYGFILSYPKDNQYYVFEPWHWRYVGKKLASDLRTQNKSFYNLDQRKIDEYLVSVFE